MPRAPAQEAPPTCIRHRTSARARGSRQWQDRRWGQCSRPGRTRRSWGSYGVAPHATRRGARHHHGADRPGKKQCGFRNPRRHRVHPGSCFAEKNPDPHHVEAEHGKRHSCAEAQRRRHAEELNRAHKALARDLLRRAQSARNERCNCDGDRKAHKEGDHDLEGLEVAVEDEGAYGDEDKDGLDQVDRGDGAHPPRRAEESAEREIDGNQQAQQEDRRDRAGGAAVVHALPGAQEQEDGGQAQGAHDGHRQHHAPHRTASRVW